MLAWSITVVLLVTLKPVATLKIIPHIIPRKISLLGGMSHLGVSMRVLNKRIQYFCHEQQLSLWPLTPPPTPFPDLSCLPHKLPASPPKSPENGEQMARLQLQLPPFANSAAFSAVLISGMSSDCRRGQFDFCSTRQPAAWCYCYLSGFWPCTGKSVKHSTNFSDFLSCGKAGDTGTK